MILLAVTQNEAGMTPEKPTHSKQKGTPMFDWTATPSSNRISSNPDTEAEECELVSRMPQPRHGLQENVVN